MESHEATTQTTNRPLKVSIIGAGIAGLAAAIALRRNGHHVQIFEAASENKEVGAAIGVPVNCVRVLEHLGYAKENLKSVNFDGYVTLDAISAEIRTSPWLTSPVDEKPNILCHRSDLHNELQRLALGPGNGPPAVRHLASRVVECEPETGSLALSDGRVIQSDLIIGADGISSVLRTHILGSVQKSVGSGVSCYRALIETSRFDGLPELAWLRDGISGPRSVAQRGGPFRLLFIYPCRSGTLINVAAMFDDPHQDDPDWTPTAPREEVQTVYADFHPQFQPVLAALEARVAKWQLRTVPVLPTWVRGRAGLMGDAAHATLPTLGQGAAMAVEEAGALGALFPAGTAPMDVPVRLVAYEALRKERGEFVGRESLQQARIPAKFGEYIRSKEMQEYMMDYDAVKAAQEMFQARFGGTPSSETL